MRFSIPFFLFRHKPLHRPIMSSLKRFCKHFLFHEEIRVSVYHGGLVVVVYADSVSMYSLTSGTW